MEIDTMGKVLVTVCIENLKDLYLAETRVIAEQDVRRIVVDDALVDTGATGLSMPKRLIDQLGLTPTRVRRARTSAGPVDVQMYGGVKLTVQDRDCLTDVAELPDDCPVLVGQIPLEVMDFVVDPRAHRLIGNPAHGGEHILELY